MPVDEGEGRDVCIAGGELHAEWFPERGDRVSAAGRKFPRGADPVCIVGEHCGGVSRRIRRHFGEGDAWRQVLLDLKNSAVYSGHVSWQVVWKAAMTRSLPDVDDVSKARPAWSTRSNEGMATNFLRARQGQG